MVLSYLLTSFEIESRSNKMEKRTRMLTKHIDDIADNITEELQRIELNSTRIECGKEKKRSDVIKLQQSIERDDTRLQEIQHWKSNLTTNREVLH